MTPEPFDPARHLSLVSGKEYLEVKWRIVWFRSEYPEGRIETELHSYSEREAVMKASVTAIRDGVVVGFASDYGSETPQDFGDFLEKASTKSIGRALAALGFGTQFCADHDFGASQGRVVDSPVQRNNPTPIQRQQPQQQAPRQQQGGDEQWTNRNPPSDKQIGMMKKLIDEKQLGDEQVTELALQSSNGYAKTFHQMSKADSSKFIDALINGTPSAPPSSGYANSSRQEANQSRGNMQDEATANQRGLISKLWLERGGSDEPGSKHTYVRDVMGIEWEDMTKQDATDFIGKLKQPDWTPFS